MSVVLPCWIRVRRQRLTIGGSGRLGDRSDVLGQQSGVSNTGESQRPPEGATPLRQREAGLLWMHMCTSTRQSTGRVRLKPEIVSRPNRHEPQQCDGRCA